MNLNMYGLLHMRVHRHHLRVQIWMVPHQDLRIPSTCDKDGIDTAAERRGEDVADLQANEEGEGENNRRVRAITVVLGRREDQVAVGHESAGVTDEHGADGEDRTDKAFVDKCVDAAIFDQTDALC